MFRFPAAITMSALQRLLMIGASIPYATIWTHCRNGTKFQELKCSLCGVCKPMIRVMYARLREKPSQRRLPVFTAPAQSMTAFLCLTVHKASEKALSSKTLWEMNTIPFSEMDKADSIRRWNNGEIPVGLIHPASAGHGLNLQSGGNTIVWFGLTWSLELYSQTNARLWRQGQHAETVVLQHIVTEDTIDKRILKALTEKDNTQQSLINAVKANLEVAK